MKRINKYGISLNQDRIPMLVKESSIEYHNNTIANPESIVRIMNEVFNLSNQAEECINMIAVNTKGEVVGVFEIARGDLHSSNLHPREIFKRAILCNASAIALAHNHPSGDPEPSQEDIETTEKIVRAGLILNIKVWDHVVVGDGRYVSIVERGLV